MPGSSGTERAGPSLPGVLLALAGAMTFSGKAIIVKLAYRYGVDAVTVIMFRMLFALPIFLGMAWWASRGKRPLTVHGVKDACADTSEILRWLRRWPACNWAVATGAPGPDVVSTTPSLPESRA